MRWAPLVLCLSACVRTPQPPPDCPLGGELFQQTELYFGLTRSDGNQIEQTTFDLFVEQYVVPQLPTGFTSLAGEGRWLEGAKDIREPSRVLIVLHHGDQPVDQALENIRTRYKQLFAQQSVLRVDSRACARF
ncbi:MAG TPA: DUF3574 domain-containing protein [Polyangiales bacterium]|nr:DUF3574 domain-containing protein [Polyangiales bacterium]